MHIGIQENINSMETVLRQWDCRCHEATTTIVIQLPLHMTMSYLIHCFYIAIMLLVKYQSVCGMGVLSTIGQKGTNARLDPSAIMSTK